MQIGANDQTGTNLMQIDGIALASTSRSQCVVLAGMRHRFRDRSPSQTFFFRS
jgi:general bacterial porin, GBP family